MKRHLTLLAAFTTANLLIGQGADAQNTPGSSGAGADQSTGAEQSTGAGVADIVIGELERRLMHDYYAQSLHDWESTNSKDGKGNGHQKGNKDFPPGLAKRGTLPPGLAKQLAKNGQLPPGLAYRDLPPDLLAQLPPLGAAYRYRIVDDRVLLIRAATNAILDVLKVPAL